MLAAHRTGAVAGIVYHDFDARGLGNPTVDGGPHGICRVQAYAGVLLQKLVVELGRAAFRLEYETVWVAKDGQVGQASAQMVCQ